MKRIINKKLFINFFLAFFLLSGLTILSYNVFQYFNVRKRLLNRNKSTLYYYARRTARLINKSMLLKENRSNEIADIPSIKQFISGNDFLAPHVNEYLSELQKINFSTHSIVYLLNKNGVCVASSLKKIIGENYSFRSYFKQAIKGKKYLSDYAVGVTTNEAGFYSSAPIKLNGKIIGVAVVKFKSDFNEIVNNVKIENGYVFIINQDKIILAQPDIENAYYYINEMPEEILNKILVNRQFPEGSLKQLKIIGFPTGKITERSMLTLYINGVEYFSVIQRAGSTNYYAVALIRIRELYTFLKYLVSKSLLILVIITIFITLVSYYFARYFTGIYRELAEKTAEIESINNFTKEVLKTNDLESVIYKIADFLKNKYQFNGVGLELVTPDKKSYRIVKYVVPEELKQITQKYLNNEYSLDKAGDNVAKAILKKQLIYLPQITGENVDTPGVKKYIEKLAVRSALIIPIIVDAEAIGALVLRSHFHPRLLSEREIKSIELFVNQIGIILKNAKIYGELQEKNIELESIGEISQKMREAVNIGELFDEMADYFSSKYKFNGFALIAVEADKKHYRIQKFRVPPKYQKENNRFTHYSFPLNEKGGRVAECILSKKLAYFTDINPKNIENEVSKEAIEALDLKTILIIPIIAENTVIGTFNLHSHHNEIIVTMDDIKSIETFINQFAILMRNVMLYEEITRKSGELEKAYAELQQSNMELINTLELARQANKAKTTFLTMMSHELRTPLAGIVGFSEILISDPDLTSEQKEYSRIIYDCGKRLLQILNDLLQITTLETGKINFVYTTFNINDLMEDIYILLKNDFMKKGVSYYQDTDGVSEIYADEPRLRQILLNLVGNAIKFTEKGEVKVVLEKHHKKYHFIISDTGIGISESHKEDIFDMFKQIENLENRKYGGTGLGLAICKRLVDALGGNIWVDTSVSIGSTFHFEIPIPEKPETQSSI